MPTIELIDLQVPAFGSEAALPPLPPQEYAHRLTATIGRMKARGLDALAVYGDREHFANLAYLTGYDPRFEEAVLLVDARGASVLLVGNEGLGYLPDPWPELRVQLFQDFSLPGQPRGKSPPLREILRGFGLRPGLKLGCSGWKTYAGQGVEGGETALDVPSYLADLLRDLAGGRDRVVNAADIFMGVEDGLRLTSGAAQIAQFEFAATRCSEAVWAVIRHIREGASERELSRAQQVDGLPHSCHAMVSTGAKAARGLASPGDGRVRLGDAFTTAVGLWGSLTARAGVVAHGPQDLAPDLRTFFPDLARNYFDVVATWYEHVRIGATAGEVFAAVDQKRDGRLFDFALNPGHYVHLDEWTNSPFFAGSPVKLRSGMAFQMDIIPVSKGPMCCVNAEDGIALADEGLRKELAEKIPGLWHRTQARQRFMREKLGIRIDDGVLPLSSYPGVFAPFLLAPGKALVKKA